MTQAYACPQLNGKGMPCSANDSGATRNKISSCKVIGVGSWGAESGLYPWEHLGCSTGGVRDAHSFGEQMITLALDARLYYQTDSL